VRTEAGEVRGRQLLPVWSSSPTPYRSRSSSSSASRGQSDLKKAPFREGIIPSGKPKASDYEDGVKRRLLETMSYYETYLLTNDAYPSQKKQVAWAKEAWLSASENLEAVECFELSLRMQRMV
jgi:hypothetical protein